jgi:hypothetical protein
MPLFCARILLALLMLIISQLAYAERTDIVYLKNGDRITGEVKSLFRGKLEFKTDHMGTLFIEWTDIREIMSKTGQSVELANGQRFYGPLAKPQDEEMLVVATDQGEVGVNTLDVISIYPVEAGFWDRLDVSANLGFNWDKGSNVGKYEFGLDAEYRLPKSITRASFNSEVTTQANANNTERSNLGMMHNRFQPNKKFRTYFGDIDHNDELGIDLRVLLGAGYGWVPIRSNKNWFSLAGGLDINREIPIVGEAQNNIEAVGMMMYEYYRYSTPERVFKVNLMVFPSLTDLGRWRTDFNTEFRLEFVEDLFWMMKFYANYDSAPISSEGASSDYGVTSSIGYKF